MSAIVDKAVEKFDQGFSCSQAVLFARCEEFGMDPETALRVAGAFGGGMGHIGEACGAVTGALMLLGLKYGKVRAEDAEAKERTYAKVREYTDAFKAKRGSIKCSELLGYDISKPEELARARAAGVFKTVCPLLIADSLELVGRQL
jgi:C_GCAxxG_C_C family probable redox protein